MATALKTSNTVAARHAVIKEIIYRKTGLSLFDTQLATALSLQQGKIAELPTGEGKTLAAVVAAICYALDGHKVHILVFNDYLARRDWSENRSIYEACGITAGFADQHSTAEQRKTAYSCDITYVSAKQAGFDYLQDFMAQSPDEVVFPAFDAAIVDEADSIMIDECTTPLVLAGEAPDTEIVAKNIDKCIKMLSTDDYELSHSEHKAWLTDKGLEYAENFLGLELYQEGNLDVLINIQNALAAHHLVKRDIDYIVKDGAVLLVEPTTGRVILNKRYPDALHRAVEIKEGIKPAPLTMIYNSITMQNFLRLYKTLCGMTGTAATSAGELDSVYGLAVDVIKPNTPSIRIDHDDLFFTSHDDYVKGIIGQICDCHSRQQPVLVGTKNVAESEMFSKLLDDIGISHCVLNAKNDEDEAALIALAGKLGRVTISTNMAGRGVDIRLGGDDKGQHKVVADLGGLFIIGTGINASERIDNQLRGRAGRQGDSGESRFFVWLGDAAITDRMTPLEKIKAEIGNAKKRVNAVRKIQRVMDAEAAEARYSLSRFSDIVEEQRKGITAQRMDILNGKLHLEILATANPAKYHEVAQTAGEDGVKRAEQQLALYFINKNWAEYLGALEGIRNGIHFRTLSGDALSALMGGGKTNVLNEYVRIVIELRDQLFENIQKDIAEKMETLPITKDGVGMGAAGMCGGTTTWTYAVDDSMFQFSKLQHVAKGIRDKFTGENGVFTRYYRKRRERLR